MTITFGIEMASAAQPLEFSNANAAAMLRMAGLPVEPCGSVAGEQLDAALRRLMRAVNVRSRRAAELRDRDNSEGWTDFGRSDEYLCRRGVELVALFAQAQRLASAVEWY